MIRKFRQNAHVDFANRRIRVNDIVSDQILTTPKQIVARDHKNYRTIKTIAKKIHRVFKISKSRNFMPVGNISGIPSHIQSPSNVDADKSWGPRKISQQFFCHIHEIFFWPIQKFQAKMRIRGR